MIDFQQMKVNNKEPVYIQVVNFVKRQIYLGIVGNGDLLPSRRELGAMLGINPNTAQKAFKMMEDEELIETPPNAASRIFVSPKRRQQLCEECTKGLVAGFLSQIYEVRMTKQELIDYVNELWKGEE